MKICRHASGSAGFTVIELVVTLALVALVFSLALPAVFDRMPYYRIDRVSSKIKAQMRATRLKAMAEGVAAKVVFDNESKEYSIWSDLNSDGVTNAAEKTRYGITDAPGTTFQVYHSDSGEFRPDGFFEVPDKTYDFIWMTIRHPSVAGYDMLVIWPSGQVTVYEYK